jgi:hypothetical protein
MQFLDSALEQMAKNVGIDGFDEVVVGASVDDFQGRGLGFIRAENDDERINVPAGQPREQVRTFPNSAVADGQRQQKYIELGLLEELVGSFVTVTFENLEVRAEA